MLRHLAPFRRRQEIAKVVHRNSFGGVFPSGRTSSISGPQTAHAASLKTAQSFLSAMPTGMSAASKVQHALASGPPLPAGPALRLKPIRTHTPLIVSPAPVVGTSHRRLRKK
jgi:hypothetical protein